MDLWVRNQNKEKLLKVDNIDISVESRYLYTHTLNGFICLGEYKTRERTLEVLDEIQDLLSPRYIVKNPPIDDEILKSFSENGIISPIKDADIQIRQANCIVYQMPEE